MLCSGLPIRLSSVEKFQTNYSIVKKIMPTHFFVVSFNRLLNSEWLINLVGKRIE